MTEPLRERRPLGRRAALAMAAGVLAVSVPLGILLAPRASGRPLAVASPVQVTPTGVTTPPTTTETSPLASPTAPASPSPAASPSPVSEALLAVGKNTYEERCSTCHGSDGTGTTQGPPIAGLGPAYYNFMMSTGRMPLDQPGVQAHRRPPVLTPLQIRAVTAYLDSIAPGGVPIPDVNPAIGDLSVGQSVFQANCAPCHGTSGRGGAVGPQDAPAVVHDDATQIAEAIRIGPGTMPVFDEDIVDQHELNSVVKYVQYLGEPDDRGGASLGGIGPLMEGFVALVAGLGLIVLVTRTIGTRA
ncbi:MAG TPA: c-type cytochrome [Actinomycetota bacterium]|nr:c-type cytochrome [Actinomycetota bacterium]